MKAVILAAGIASRLRPLTINTPKCLLKIGEKTLLERAIDALIINGVNELIIVTGYLQEQIVTFVRCKYPKLSVEFIYNEKYESTNNIYSLWLTKAHLKNTDAVLLDSDILFDPQLLKIILQTPEPDSLALNVHTLGEEEIKVIPDAHGYVKEISKTCSIPEAIGESIGIEKMSRSYLEELFKELDRMIQEEGLVNVFYEKAFERLIAKDVKFYIVDTTSFFSMELDTVEDFKQAENKLPENLR